MPFWNRPSPEDYLERMARSLDDGLRGLRHQFSQMEHRLMTAFDDAVEKLTTAVATLSDTGTANDAAIQAEIAALKAALNAGTPDPTAILAAADKISAASATMATDTAALAASLPTATSPSTGG